MPHSIIFTRRRWRVDWRYLGDVRFDRSFFDHAIDRAMQRPFTALFWRDTPIEAMLEWADRVPKLPVRGVIHHNVALRIHSGKQDCSERASATLRCRSRVRWM